MCARTTGGWTWVATKSVAVSPAWCPDCRHLGEWLCAVCAHCRLSLGVLLCGHGVRALVALLPLCAMGAWGGARGCVRLVCGVCCVVLCCTVRCVRPCRVEGRSWASRGVLRLCVRARQVAGLGQQPDQWQFPQRGVRTVVADVSGCVLCVRTASCHWVYCCMPMECGCGATAAVCDGGVGRRARLCVAGVWGLLCCTAVCVRPCRVEGAEMGVAECAAPVCARTTGCWTWAATRSMAVSPAWCPDCRR